jgi:hypothetical protein
MAQEDDRLAHWLAGAYSGVAEHLEDEKWIKNECAKNQIVIYGVWPDRTKPHEVDYEVLKGGELLEKRSGGVSKIVVPCSSRKQAIWIRNRFCDPDLPDDLV